MKLKSRCELAGVLWGGSGRITSKFVQVVGKIQFLEAVAQGSCLLLTISSLRSYTCLFMQSPLFPKPATGRQLLLMLLIPLTSLLLHFSDFPFSWRRLTAFKSLWDYGGATQLIQDNLSTWTPAGPHSTVKSQWCFIIFTSSRISTGHLRKAIIESPPTTMEGILGALSRKWGGTSSGGLEHQEKRCGGTGWPKGKDMDKEAGSMVGRGLAEEKQGRGRWKRNANRRT